MWAQKLQPPAVQTYLWGAANQKNVQLKRGLNSLFEIVDELCSCTKMKYNMNKHYSEL